MSSPSVFALFVCGLCAAPVLAQNPAQRAPLPADLSAVPADALGFVHIRVADIWNSDSLKDFRDTLRKAGEQAIAGFDKRFLPHPSTIERLTVVLIPQDQNLDREPLVVALLATKQAVEKGAFLKSALPNAVEKKSRGGSYFADEKSRTAVSFINEQIIAFGPIDAIAAYQARDAKATGALTDALHTANSKKHVVLAVNASLIPAKALQGAPPPVQPLLKAKLVTLALDMSGESKIDLSFVYGDNQQAAAAEEAVKSLAAVGRNELKNARKEMLAKVLGDGKVAPLEELPEAAMALFAPGAEEADELLANPPIQRQGTALQASIKLPGGSTGMVGMSAVGVGLLLPAVQKVREAAARAASTNNLKQIGLAMHNYNDSFGSLPPVAICDKNGKPLLSWRVALLPFVEQQALYQQFKLNEPWDSEHNKKLLQVKPKVYFSPQAPPTSLEHGLTHYRLFYGRGTVFDLRRSLAVQAIPDGSSNTFLVVEAEEGVPWTKPEEFLYDANKPLPKFASFHQSGFLALFGDGRVQSIPHSFAQIRDAITANDGKVINFP